MFRLGHLYLAMSSHDSSHDPADSPDVSHEPASHHEEPLPEEPKTPLWVTALGVALLVSGALVYLVVHEPTIEPEAAPDAAEQPAAEAEPAATPAAEPPAPPDRRRLLPRPDSSGRMPPRPFPDMRRVRPPSQPQP